MPSLAPVALIGRPKSLFDQIDDIEPPKSLAQQIDETPTQGAVVDALKRTGRSLVDQPGAVVESGGTMLDVMARALRAIGAGRATADQAFLPENLRDKPELPAEAIIRELKRPSTAARVVQDTGRQMRKDAGELYTGDFAPDPARDRTLPAMVADSTGSLAAAMATPGGVVGKTLTAALLNSQGAADDAEKQLLAAGKTEEEARAEAARQFVLNLPAGALESVAWGKLLGRYGKSLEDAVAEKWGKTALERILKTTGQQAAIEGGEEVLQQGMQNLAAKETYDPDRKLSAGMKEAGVVGTLMGGGLAGGVQIGAEVADRLDTGRNRPERPEDLKAQQQQLLDGDRAVQMFPAGTDALALPKGMARVETPRGIFHYDPRRMTADEILTASKAGRENELLGLGPHSKAEVDRRARAGEPVAAVVERGPKGEELRGAAVTPSTLEATAKAMESGKSAGSTVNLERMEDVLRGRESGSLDEMIDQAAAEQEKRAKQAASETREREERQTAAREKREKFAFHLGNAGRIAEGLTADGQPAVAEVVGSANVLRDYLQDNTLGLTLEQKQQARALLGKLQPIEARLKAAAEEQTQARLAEEKRQRDAAEAAQSQRIAAERKQLAQQKDIDPGTGKRRLDTMSDDELAEAAHGGNTAALRLLEQRSQGEAKPAEEDLLSVLKKVKLPGEDATMGSELTDLKKEWVNFGQRGQIFSGKPGSLDTVAEILRGQYGFTGIQTPADVIEFTKRALRGEKVLPSRPGGEQQVDFATAEAVQAPRRPTWDQDRGREQMPAYMAAVEKYNRDLKDYVKHGPDVLVFRSRVQENVYHLVSRNVREGEKPWRMTDFEMSPITDQMTPTAHQDFATKEEAVMSQASYTDPAPDVQFAREEGVREGRKPSEIDWHLSPSARSRIVSRGMAELESGRGQIDNPVPPSKDATDAAQAYVEKTGTPPKNAGAAKADIANLVTAAEHQNHLELSYSEPDRPRRKASHGDTAGSLRAAEALRNPTSATALLEAFEKSNTISSIIPKLVRNPLQGWDIRGAVINTPADFAAMTQMVRSPYVEMMKVAFLDGENQVLHSEILSFGSVTSSLAAPSMIARSLQSLKKATGSKRIILSHNHPSGDPGPSQADIQVTRAFRDMADALDFDLIDHVITNGETYFSFAEAGHLNGGLKNRQGAAKDVPEGRDTPLRRDLHTKADWEVLKRTELMAVNRGSSLLEIYSALKQVDPTAAYILLANRKNRIVGMERLTNFNPTKDIKALKQKIFAAGGREGAPTFFFMMPRDITRAAEVVLIRELRSFAKAVDMELMDIALASDKYTTGREQGMFEAQERYEAATNEGPAGVEHLPDEPGATPVLEDFEARLKRIAPGLMMRYKVLVGEPDLLLQMGVRREQLSGREQAAHFPRRKALWFLARNVRAGKDGLMEDRLRRDVLHETTHAWLDSLDDDTEADLRRRWKSDMEDPAGWLATMRKDKVKLRKGVENDWKEYWAERIAQENTRWAGRREGAVAGERGFVSQLAYDFRIWLQEALEYLQAAFTRTKRYNVDFRAFLDDRRYQQSEPATAGPASAAPVPLAAAQGTLELGTPVGIQLPPTVKNLTPKWQGKTLDFESSVDKALYYAGGEGNTEERSRLLDLINEQTGLSGGQVATLARKLREKLRPLTESVAADGTLRIPPQMQSEVEALAGASFATEESPEDRQAALIRQLNHLTREINAAEAGGTLGRRRGLLGNRSEIRTQLDDEFPNWRKEHPEGPDGLRREKPEQAENPEPEPEAVTPPEREFADRPGIYSDVEGHTTVRTPWAVRTWDKMKEVLRGIRGSIPELPAFADDKDQKYNRLRLFNKLIKRGTPRVWKEAADQLGTIVQPLLKLGKLDANAYDRLGRLQQRVRQLREENRPVPADMPQEIADLNRAVEREPYGLFQKLAFYLDLKWRVENLKDEQGNAIAQPGGLNVKEINDRLNQLKEHLNTSPHRAAILDALKQHQAMVKEIAADLRARDLTMPEEMQNPFYYPHIVLDKGKDTLDRVKLDTAEDFRGYLLKPVGSTKPIETDYAKAMYYHLVAVGSHNLRSDLVKDYVKPYDVMPEVKERAKELGKQYGRPVSWREAYATEYAKNGYSTFHPDDRLPLHPEMTVDRDTLARRLGVVLTEEPLHQQLEALGLKGIKLLPEDIKEALAAGEQETWILPEKVAEALNGMLRRETKTADSLISKPIQLLQAGWKKNILFAPWNYPRYEFNNTVADLEKLFSADPEVYRLLPAAAREVRQFIEDGKGGKDVHEAFKRGVLDSVTAAEVNDLTALKQFEQLQSDRDKLTSQGLRRLSTMFLAGNRSTLDVSKLREATFRYAKFKADLNRLRHNARPVYAGAYWRDIDAIEDSRQGAGDANYQKAAEISLATFGDYHNISVAGQELRRYLIPFYSWMEINFKYHANLLRNLKDMTAAGEMSAADAAKTGGRAAAVMASTFTRKAVAGVVLRLALPYLAVMMWNNSGDRDELEDTLSEEDKRRFHIILGKDDKGKTMVVYGQTAFADVAKWFGGMDGMRLAGDVMNGKTDFSTAVGQWMKRFPRDFANNLWQVGPAAKIAYTALAKKSTFPDVTDQRTIPANEVKWNILGQATDQVVADMIRRAADKDYLAPRDMKDWAQQAILQVRKRDPQQWAFYEIKDKAAQFLEAQTGESHDRSYNAPDQQVLRNFRRSIYRADVENAMRFYDRLLELGYTSEKFKQSIRAQDPLSGLSKELREDFVASLSRLERMQLTRAYEFYQRMAENRGAENALFPSKKLSDHRRQQYQPRYDRLRAEIENTERLSDDELKLKAEKELRRSLRPSQR